MPRGQAGLIFVPIPRGTSVAPLDVVIPPPSIASCRFGPLAGLVAAAMSLMWSDRAMGAQSRHAVEPSDATAADCRALDATGQDTAKRSDDASRTDRARIDAEARARYLRGDVEGALDTWNELAEPRVRCVSVDGLVRTRRASVIDYLGTREAELLTAEALARLARRLDELPAASQTSVRFDPGLDGSTMVTTVAEERGLIPAGFHGWGQVALRAAFTQDIRIPIVSPAGHGEVWTPSYRWSPNRPRALLRFDAPAPGRLPGMVSAVAMAERQTYRFAELGGEFRQSRYRFGGALSDWVTSWLRWEGGAAFDRIGAVPRLALEGSLNARAFGDRLAVIASAGHWSGARGGRPFGTGELVATVRSTATHDVPVFTTLVGIARATDAAPLAAWPAASSAEGRGAFLRAHPLRSDSVVTGEVFGRTLMFSTTEYQHPFSTRFGTVALAGFVDAGRASRRLNPNASLFHIDVGTGVRVSRAGSGAIRVDVGYGLRDGRVRLSAGYVVPWAAR